MRDSDRARSLPWFILIPVCTLLVGLEALGSGSAFGPSWTARLLAWGWTMAGGWSAAIVLASVGGGTSMPGRPLIRAGLVLWVGATACLFWCALPAPLSARIEMLARSTQGDHRTFRTLALESLAVQKPSEPGLLALATYRKKVLREPASGLALAAVAPGGATRFWHAREVWGHLEPLLGASAAVDDIDARFRSTRGELFHRLAGGTGVREPPRAELSPVDHRELATLARSAGGFGEHDAKRALARLAQCDDPALWDSPEFHLVAAAALASLGRATAAALELDLADHHEKRVEIPAGLRERLAALAGRLIDDSRRARARLEETRAAELACDALATHPGAIPTGDEVMRFNIESGLQQQLRRAELAEHGSALDATLNGRDRDQVDGFERAHDLVLLARSLHVSGRPDDALRLLGRATSPCADRYLDWTIRALERRWSRLTR